MSDILTSCCCFKVAGAPTYLLLRFFLLPVPSTQPPHPPLSFDTVPFFLTWSVVNSVAWAYHSTQALPVTTVMLILFIWVISEWVQCVVTDTRMRTHTHHTHHAHTHTTRAHTHTHTHCAHTHTHTHTHIHTHTHRAHTHNCTHTPHTHTHTHTPHTHTHTHHTHTHTHTHTHVITVNVAH